MTGWIHEKGLPSGKYALDVGYFSGGWLHQMTHVPTGRVHGPS